MNVGTRSVLYGAHAFWLHPWFVAEAWSRLYGFPWDPRLWVIFFTHDLGYLGKPNMDGDEGERHPEWAAQLMFKWFEHWKPYGIEVLHKSRRGGLLFRGDGERRLPPPNRIQRFSSRAFNWLFGERPQLYWHDLTLYHSRFYAKTDGQQPSRLCMADKLAISITPWWLYLPMTIATGEIREYMGLAKTDRHSHEHAQVHSDVKDSHLAVRLFGMRGRWYLEVQQYVREWVEEHKDGREDTWTREVRQARTDSGVWL